MTPPSCACWTRKATTRTVTDNLRAYVRLVLEARKETKDLRGEGLALLVHKQRDGFAVVMYDPNVIWDKVEQYLVDAEKQFEKDEKAWPGAPWNVDVWDVLGDTWGWGDAAKGYMYVRKPWRSTGKCHGSWEVGQSAARNKYGPILYDIAMSLTPNNTLMPDRGSVSDSASGVWQYYNSKRGDVEKLKLDDISNPKTPPKYDDCYVHGDPYYGEGRPHLDFAYRLRRSPAVKRLQAANIKFIRDMAKYLRSWQVKNVTQKRIKRALDEFGDDLFSELY